MEVGKPGDPRPRDRLARPSSREHAADEAERAAARHWRSTTACRRCSSARRDTLPIPDPANFGLSAARRRARSALAWLGDVLHRRAEPLKSSALEHAAARSPSSSTDQHHRLRAGERRRLSDHRASATRCARRGADQAPTSASRRPRSTSAAGTRTARRVRSPAAMATTMRDSPTRLRVPRRHGRRQPHRPLTVVVMSEFGRKVQENGSEGTDHGRGNVMFVMGGRRRRARADAVAGHGDRAALSGAGSEGDDRLSRHPAEIVSRRLGNTQLDVVFPGYTPTFRGAVV